MKTFTATILPLMLVISGCATSPKPGDITPPSFIITAAEVNTGSAAVIVASMHDTVTASPQGCPPGSQVKSTLPGSQVPVSQFDAYHIVSSYPVKVTVLASDESGIKFMNMHNVGAIISDPVPADILTSQNDMTFHWMYNELITARSTSMNIMNNPVPPVSSIDFVFKYQQILSIAYDGNNNNSHLEILFGKAGDLCE